MLTRREIGGNVIHSIRDRRLPAWALVTWGQVGEHYIVAIGDGAFRRATAAITERTERLAVDPWFRYAFHQTNGAEASWAGYVRFDRLRAYDDPLLAEVVTEALRADLRQSQLVKVMEPGEVAEVLERMQRPSEARLDDALAGEIAEREGIKAIIAGDIGTAGTGYVLTARVLSGRDGGVLTSQRVTADDSTKLRSTSLRIGLRRAWSQNGSDPH